MVKIESEPQAVVNEPPADGKPPAAADDVGRVLSDLEFAVWDIETGPLADDVLDKLCPAFVPPPPPGEFDESAVKYGNTKDKDKRAAKLAECRADHAASVEGYAAKVEADRASHCLKFKEKAALDATTGRVVAIGTASSGMGSAMIFDGGATADDEEACLCRFWAWASSCLQTHRPMVGFNIHAFDIPFLRQRSWILGVPIPLGVMQGRYPNPLFIDLMKEWTCHQAGKLIKLDTVAKACGLNGKASGQFTLPSGEVVTVDGENFYKAWGRPECRKWAEEYLMADLRIPMELASRMGIA